jgi:FkbM family methyltransferase
MKSLRELALKFRIGELSKPDYINEMNEKHIQLLEYAAFIKDTDIEKIEIGDDFVTMTQRHTGIKFVYSKSDKRIAPIEILNFGSYEKTEFEMVLRLIEAKFNIFDIGANIGWYAINIAKTIKSVNIFAFEPIPGTFESLKMNLNINNMANIQIFNFGFSNKTGELTFYINPENSVNASGANLSDYDSVVKINCKVRRMDDFVKETDLPVDFIKCDVEGAELMVFQGGIETIERYKPIIYTEMLRKWSGKFNYHPNEIINLLHNQGYRCFIAENAKLVEFTGMNHMTNETNFFFLHNEKHHSDITRLI